MWNSSRFFLQGHRLYAGTDTSGWFLGIFYQLQFSESKRPELQPGTSCARHRQLEAFIGQQESSVAPCELIRGYTPLKKCYQAWKLGRLEFPGIEFFVWNWIEIINNQALWGNYLKNGVSEYISIQVTQSKPEGVPILWISIGIQNILSIKWTTPFQAQDFDVPSSVLSHLVHAGIVKIHPR